VQEGETDGKHIWKKVKTKEGKYKNKQIRRNTKTKSRSKKGKGAEKAREEKKSRVGSCLNRRRGGKKRMIRTRKSFDAKRRW
jgi:hypothetical protein